MPSWFMVPLVSWLSCFLNQQMSLSNLRRFEIYRQYIGADYTRSVSLGSFFFRRFWPLLTTLSPPPQRKGFWVKSKTLNPLGPLWSTLLCEELQTAGSWCDKVCFSTNWRSTIILSCRFNWRPKSKPVGKHQRFFAAQTWKYFKIMFYFRFCSANSYLPGWLLQNKCDFLALNRQLDHQKCRPHHPMLEAQEVLAMRF